MTSDRSPRALLRRASQTGSLPVIRVGPAEQPRIDLRDALGIPIVIERGGDERFGAAAVRARTAGTRDPRPRVG